MSDFVIEKNVPIPEAPKKYPFMDMEIGDSFFAEGTQPTRLNNSTSSARKAGRRFTMRSVTEENAEGKEVQGTRVWRVE